MIENSAPQWLSDPRLFLMLLPPLMVWFTGFWLLARCHRRRTGTTAMGVHAFLGYLRYFSLREWLILLAVFIGGNVAGWIGMFVAWHILIRPFE